MRCKNKRKMIMRQDGSSKHEKRYRGRAGPGLFFAVTLAVILLSVAVSTAIETARAKETATEKARQTSSLKEKALAEKTKETLTEKQKEIKTGVTTSTDGNSAGNISPTKFQDSQLLSGPAVRDKGRQIKWQVVCTGGNCGAGNVTFLLGPQADYYTCGTVGQTAVGPGTSPSFGTNSGFWQDFLGGFLRGDANGDGVINLEDVVYMVNYLYKCGPCPSPLEAGNSNCDGVLDVGDVVYLVNFILKEGPPPSC
jgi:hypothetical protein